MNPANPKPWRIPGALVLILLLVFASPALPQENPNAPTTPQVPGAAAESPAKQRLTPRDRKEVFEKICREIHDPSSAPSHNGADWHEQPHPYPPPVDPPTH